MNSNKVLAYYVWLDGKYNLRTKMKVQDEAIFSNWNADGSSTFQAGLDCSEIILKPVKHVKINPKYFNMTTVYNESHEIYIVLCEVYDKDKKVHKSNSRYKAKKIFDKYAEQEIMFGLEQEYYIVNAKTGLPDSIVYDKLEKGLLTEQQNHYCYIGIEENIGRKIAEHHMYACLDCGLSISGINGEVGPCQWEFQIGPVIGIDASDQLIIARFLLMKIAEMYGCLIDFRPKPFGENISGSGCHINISTKSMREENGIDDIYEAIEKLGNVAEQSIQIYGEENKERLSGRCETASWEKFSYSVGGRDVSIRIGYDIEREGKGYFEDRRPSSNSDFYKATSHILEVISN